MSSVIPAAIVVVEMLLYVCTVAVLEVESDEDLPEIGPIATSFTLHVIAYGALALVVLPVLLVRSLV